MPNGYKGQVSTQCPYYIRESDYTITCECIYRACETAIKFPNEMAKEDFQEKKCNNLDSNCIFRKLLDKKYNNKQ